MKTKIIAISLSAALFAAAMLPSAHAERAFLLNGLDEKVGFDESGRPVFSAPGRDKVNIMDIGTDPSRPRTVADLPIMNSLFGPPTNLQVTPDENLALVANAMQWVQDAGQWKPAPDNRLFVIDLQAKPPVVRETIEIGRQPSGVAISRRGDLALVANRADKSVSVLAIDGTDVRFLGTVPVDDEVAAVAIAPNGRRALALKNTANKVAVLEIDGRSVTYDKNMDMPVGQFPYNVDITPDGRIALIAHTGNGGRSDGHADPMAVIDLTQNPPRVIDYVSVGDAPEAFAISPTGKIAAALLLGGEVMLPKDHWGHSRAGSLVILKIDGMRVAKIEEIVLGGLPEGVAFSPNGDFMYVSNFVHRDVRVYRVNGTKVQDTGERVQLPGHPGSMRARAR